MERYRHDAIYVTNRPEPGSHPSSEMWAERAARTILEYMNRLSQRALEFTDGKSLIEGRRIESACTAFVSNARTQSGLGAERPAASGADRTGYG